MNLAEANTGKICHVVGGGDFSPTLLRQNFRRGDLLIAADHGGDLLGAAGFTPAVIIGDFDSSVSDPAASSAAFPPEIVRLPVEKDDTDLAAAAFLGIKRGFSNFFLYGALGGRRFSHSLSAVQLLAALFDKGSSAAVIDENCTVFALQNGTLSISKDGNLSCSHFDDGFSKRLSMAARFTRPGDLLSLLVLSDSAIVSERGLKYPLENANLTNRYPLGVSSAFTGEDAFLEVREGLALLVLEKGEMQ